MNVNPFSFLSYEELRKIVQKGDDSLLAKATLAYKNPNYQRSISSLEKLLLSFPLAIEFLYFRSLAKVHLKDNERYKDLNDPLIAHAVDLFVFFETHPSFEEVLQRNLYLAFLYLIFLTMVSKNWFMATQIAFMGQGYMIILFF